MNNFEPINMPTSNETEASAQSWLNMVIKERGRKQAESIVRYNLTGQNQYYRFNNVYDTFLAHLVNKL
jgi:hypothetical protein